jgi:hypothetical protein
METITIYPKNDKQNTLLKTLLEEMKVKFETAKDNLSTKQSEKSFYAKIDKSLKQAANGQTTVLPKDKQKEFLGL